MRAHRVVGRAVKPETAFVPTRSGITTTEVIRMGDFDPEYVFSHHTATPEKLAHYDAIHTGAKSFAEVILSHVPECTDRLAVLRLLREASMLACAAIALEGRLR